MQLRNKSHEKKSFAMSSKVMCNFFVLFFLSNSVRKSSKMAQTCPKMVKIQFFKPRVTKIWNLGHMQLFHFFNFFQFSKEYLQSGRNVPKKGQNSKFATLVAKIWHFLVAEGPLLIFFTCCLVTGGPESPAGARIYWNVVPINSSMNINRLQIFYLFYFN